MAGGSRLENIRNWYANGGSRASKRTPQRDLIAAAGF